MEQLKPAPESQRDVYDAKQSWRRNVESDIPAEWRISEGAQLKTEFTESESEQVELDRR